MAGLAFAQNYAPVDYRDRAAAGVTLDPSAPDQAPQVQAPQAMPPQQAPQAQPQAPTSALPDIPVSPLEALGAWFFHGGSQTPGEAAQSVRAVKLKNLMDQIGLQQAQQRWALAQKLDAPSQLDYLTDPAAFVKSDAKNLEPQNPAEGTSLLFRGGQGHQGGSTYFAPKTGVSPTGVPFAITKDGYQALAPQQPGDKTVSPSGAVIDSHLGPTGQSVSVPNNVPLGTTPGEFTPRINGGPQTQAAPVPALAGVPAGKFDAAGFIKSFILPHEGGLNPHDMNGAPTKYGINQSANPGVDVPNLTPQGATQIYMQKYLPMSGAESLPPALAMAHMDTLIINPARAKQFLQQSGGDPSKYMDLRDQWMQHLVQTDPAAAPYARAWGQRNADLRAVIGQAGGSAPGSQPINAPPPLPPGSDAGQPGFHALGAAVRNRTLTPQEAQAAGYAPGSVVEEDPTGRRTVSQAPVANDGIRAMRNDIHNSDEWKDNVNSTNAANAFTANLLAAKGNNAVFDTAAADNFVRAATGLSAKQGSMTNLLDHLPMADQLRGQLQQKFGNSYITPKVINEIGDSIYAYAKGHAPAVQARIDSNDKWSSSHYGEPTGVQLPPITPRPSIPWLDDNGQVQGAPKVALPPGVPPQEARKPGVYQTPRGPATWDGQRWQVGPH